MAGSFNKDSILDMKNTSIDNKVELPKDEAEIQNFWSTQCQILPENGKVGDYIHEHEQLLFEIDSQDIWVRVKLQMVERLNIIDAEMDLKIDKLMPRSEFDNLIQKLALKMWNECSQVFSRERWKEFKRMAQNQAPSQNSSLSKVEIEACKNIFVLQNFQIVIANTMIPQPHDPFRAR